jgi:poly-gamma-glutamate synthesis protein (capsule biosynthesis protein)
VDLVLGAHPHVIQGVEVYQGRYIVYSLANFSFGGNANPLDQHSFIFQQEFTFYRGVWDGQLNTNIIPIFVSSIRATNDFVPTPAYGADAERILARIERYSREIGR